MGERDYGPTCGQVNASNGDGRLPSPPPIPLLSVAASPGVLAPFALVADAALLIYGLVGQMLCGTAITYNHAMREARARAAAEDPKAATLRVRGGFAAELPPRPPLPSEGVGEVARNAKWGKGHERTRSNIGRRTR